MHVEASARLRSGLKPLQRACHEALAWLARLPFPRPGPTRVEPDRAVLARRLADLEGSLARELLPYWSRRTWDATRGFVAPPDLVDRSPGGSPLRFQARMIWTFAHAHRHGLTGAGYLELARRGVERLVERMWDDRHGGFPSAVDDDGPLGDAVKETGDQSCAIFALAEYAAASGDRRVLERAEGLYDLLAAHGAEEGAGFHEVFTRDWRRAAPPGRPARRLGTQLHMIETLTTLAAVTGRARHAAALAGQVDVVRRCAIDRATGCAPPSFDRGWRPRRQPGGLRLTSYGHNVELGWMLLDAADVLGEPRGPGQAEALGLLDHALRGGFDHERGGLATYGPWQGHVRHARYLSPRRLWKGWWQQAELLVALAEAYRWTGEPRYGAALERQLDWVWRHQIDTATGNWIALVDWRGRPTDARPPEAAHDPYHSGRALMRVSRVLRGLGIR
jgi:mannobiose 2-epimerase